MCISLCAGESLDLALSSGRVLGFEAAGPTRLDCRHGSLWVTAPACGDVVLDAEQTLTVSGSGRVVVQALTTARFVIRELATV